MGGASLDRLSLASVEIGRRVRIVAARLEDGAAAAWLAAVGLAEGEEVIVLRRAALGGPLHVRLATGGEFAVAREIGRKLHVSACEPEASERAASNPAASNPATAREPAAPEAG